MHPSIEVYAPLVTAMLAFFLSTPEETPAVYGSDSVSTHVSKILPSNPRKIFHSVLSGSTKAGREMGHYLCFQAQFLEFADNSMQMQPC